MKCRGDNEHTHPWEVSGTAHGRYWSQDQGMAEQFPTSQHLCAPWFTTGPAQFLPDELWGLYSMGNSTWSEGGGCPSQAWSSSRKDFVEIFWFLLPLEPFLSFVNNLSYGSQSWICPHTPNGHGVMLSCQVLAHWENDDGVVTRCWLNLLGPDTVSRSGCSQKQRSETWLSWAGAPRHCGLIRQRQEWGTSLPFGGL